jgi:hypothetical protein
LDFSKDLKGKFINVRVTKGVHRPGRPCRTKPELDGHKRWSSGPILAGRPHFGTKSSNPLPTKRRQRKNRPCEVGLDKIDG